MSTRLIMLVDDNKIDLFIHSEIIRRMPFEKTVLQYTFAGDALDYLQENELANWPDVILLDIYMPGINGFDFLEKYSAFPKPLREKCRVIMASSSLDVSDLRRVRQNSYVSDFLEKPLDMDKFFKMLNPAE